MSLQLGFISPGQVRRRSWPDGVNLSAGGLAEIHDGLIGPDPADAQVAKRGWEVRFPRYLHRPGLSDAQHLCQFRQGDDLRWRTHNRTLSSCTLDYLYLGPGSGVEWVRTTACEWSSTKEGR